MAPQSPHLAHFPGIASRHELYNVKATQRQTLRIASIVWLCRRLGWKAHTVPSYAAMSTLRIDIVIVAINRQPIL